MFREGTYEVLVHVGSDSSHNKTGGQGAIGLHRFLPWHRRYLWEFESCLQRIDCRLRPTICRCASLLELVGAAADLVDGFFRWDRLVA